MKEMEEWVDIWVGEIGWVFLRACEDMVGDRMFHAESNAGNFFLSRNSPLPGGICIFVVSVHSDIPIEGTRGNQTGDARLVTSFSFVYGESYALGYEQGIYLSFVIFLYPRVAV